MSKIPRTTCFCATVNETNFLRNKEGNRRYVVIPLSDVDIEKLRALPKEFYRNLWREAWQMYMADKGCYRLSAEDIEYLNLENEKYRKGLPFEAEIEDVLSWDLNRNYWVWKSATEVKTILMMSGVVPASASAEQIGTALTALMRKHPDIQKRKSGGIMRYYLPKIG